MPTSSSTTTRSDYCLGFYSEYDLIATYLLYSSIFCNLADLTLEHDYCTTHGNCFVVKMFTKPSRELLQNKYVLSHPKMEAKAVVHSDVRFYVFFKFLYQMFSLQQKHEVEFLTHVYILRSSM